MLHVIAPAFNEADGIQVFIRELSTHLPENSRIYIVDDGSADQTFEKVKAARELVPHEILALKLSRNFGHQAALHAGLCFAFESAAETDVFIVLDSDMQHPPRFIPEMLNYLKSGIHHVQMVRADRNAKVSLFKKLTSSLFYRFFSWLSQTHLPGGGSDFRGFSYHFIKSYMSIKEVNRFNRGLFVWMGFATLKIPYVPDSRMTGESKYSVWKMLRLGFIGITQFSNKPLILFHLLITGLSFLFCGTYLVIEGVRYMMGYHFEPGWPTVVFLISFWGGTLAAGNLMTSVYIGSIFNEVKARPIFLTENTEVNPTANSNGPAHPDTSADSLNR